MARKVTTAAKNSRSLVAVALNGLRLHDLMFGAACAIVSCVLTVSPPRLALRVQSQPHICSVLTQAPDAQLYWHMQMDVPWSRAELLEDRLRSQASISSIKAQRRPELVSGPKSFSQAPRKEIVAPLPEDVRTVVASSPRAAAQAVDSWITRRVAHQLPEDVAPVAAKHAQPAPSIGSVATATTSLQPNVSNATKPAVAAPLLERRGSKGRVAV